MTIENQVAAIEHLLSALLFEASKQGVDLEAVKGRAISTLLDSDGPGDPEHKGMACDNVRRIISLNKSSK